ncbi:MAG: LptA/OstA family protein [Candidatus Rariloculaceae bacterium]
MVNSILKFCSLGVALLLSAAVALGADEGEPSPILLDAESSSFYQKNQTVVFNGLQITQGEMSIRADTAVASGLDFERSEWQFDGNVQISVGAAKILADSAELIFESHTLVVAELRGEPAEFEDLSDTREQPIRGSANLLSYDSVNNTLRMTEGARLSEGSNDISGCDLIYDLEQEKLTSGSSECGTPLVITIIPPSDGDLPEAAPPQ